MQGPHEKRRNAEVLLVIKNEDEPAEREGEKHSEGDSTRFQLHDGASIRVRSAIEIPSLDALFVTPVACQVLIFV